MYKAQPFLGRLAAQFSPTEEFDLGTTDQWENGKSAQLYGADLRNLRARLVDLRGADLRFASLEGANLSKVIFRRARLINSNCVNANFHFADLRGTNLFGAILIDAQSTALTYDAEEDALTDKETKIAHAILSSYYERPFRGAFGYEKAWVQVGEVGLVPAPEYILKTEKKVYNPDEYRK